MTQKENPTCVECWKEFENYSVIESGMMKGTRVEKPDICQKCMSRGWRTATLEDNKI